MRKNLNFQKFLSVCITIVSCLFISTSCNSQKKEHKESFNMAAAKKAVERQNIIFNEAMNKSDSVATANCYAKGAKFMMPNAKALLVKIIFFT